MGYLEQGLTAFVTGVKWQGNREKGSSFRIFSGRQK